MRGFIKIACMVLLLSLCGACAEPARAGVRISQGGVSGELGSCVSLSTMTYLDGSKRRSSQGSYEDDMYSVDSYYYMNQNLISIELTWDKRATNKLLSDNRSIYKMRGDLAKEVEYIGGCLDHEFSCEEMNAAGELMVGRLCALLYK
jgi:hypothetical protein